MVNKIVSFSYRKVNNFIKNILTSHNVLQSYQKYFELKLKFYQVIFLMTRKNYKVKKFDKCRKIRYHFKAKHNTVLANRDV